MAKINDNPWYLEDNGFFGDDDFYLREYAESVSPEVTGEEVDFLEHRLNLAPGSSILDLACGQGRHAIALALRGYKVTGLDASKKLLDKARIQNAKMGQQIDFLHGDMRYLPFESQFDLAICMFTSLGYFESESDNEKVIANAQKALKPNGRLVLDVANRDWILKHHRSSLITNFADGSSLSIQRRFDYLASRQYEERCFVSEGVRKSLHSNLRLYSLHELNAIFNRNSLPIEKSFGDFNESPVSSDAPRCIVIGKKL